MTNKEALQKIQDILTEVFKVEVETDNTRGFGEIKTTFGGRKVASNTKRIKEWLESGDKWKILAANAMPQFVVFNQDLSIDQQQLFDWNNQYYYHQAILANDIYNTSCQCLKGYENQDIQNHLVACAANASYPNHKDYDKYWEGIDNSLKFYLENLRLRYESGGLSGHI